MTRARRRGLDVTAVTASELAAIREFLARRDRLAREARDRVGLALASASEVQGRGLAAG